jgi:hypothetical protein
MFLRQNYKLLIGESLVVAIMWGIPSWLVFRAWRRYRRLNTVQTSLRVAMSSLLVSEAMLLLVGVIVVVANTSTAEMPGSPQGVGFINFVLCAIALLSLFVAKTEETVRVRRAITAATIYLMFVWLYAMMAH